MAMKNRSKNAKCHVNRGSNHKSRSVPDLWGLTKEQLRQELRHRGMKASGKKSELVRRLQKVLPSDPLMKRDIGTPYSEAMKRKTTSQSNGESPRHGGPSLGEKDKEEEKQERQGIVLWRHPVTTVNYFCKELVIDTYSYGQRLLRHKAVLVLVLTLTALSAAVYHIRGPHQKYIQPLEKQMLWCLYWIGLGILSSVGLGTGLHTFLLYLGPHIASVTLAAYECGSLRFPEPPYPDDIVCPNEPDPSSRITVWTIMSKVRLEAFMWGAGTALGELPPYFMARAARLSGYDPDDEDDLAEFEELQRKLQHPEQMTMFDRAKLGVERLVERVGFLGILACASIPNPLFDLAGITCGHFLVPFWTFFGATLIGKAVIKMHIQKLFVIISFNETLLEKAVSLLAYIPYVGPKLQEPFKELLIKQKAKLHRKAGSAAPSESSLLASIFEKFVIGMIIYFILSIINSLAQSYHKRIHKKAREPKVAKD